MTEIVSFFLTMPGCANKLVLNYLGLAIHRTNIGKEHLVKVYLRRNFNCSSEKINRTGAIIPTRKPDAVARVFLLRDHSTLAATFDTCCHSSASKINAGLIVPSGLKNCESMQVLYLEEMEDWDIVLKTSWYFLTTDRMFFFLFFLFKSVLLTSAKSCRAGLRSVLSKSLVPSI